MSGDEAERDPGVRPELIEQVDGVPVAVIRTDDGGIVAANLLGRRMLSELGGGTSLPVALSADIESATRDLASGVVVRLHVDAPASGRRWRLQMKRHAKVLVLVVGYGDQPRNESGSSPA